MAKNRLHQLLAVDADLRNKAAKIAQETASTFRTKSDHFDGYVRTYRPFIEPENELMKQAPDIKDIVTTVQDKLNYTAKSLKRAIDAHLSKEQTNCKGEAMADLQIGANCMPGLSSTALLALEGWLVKIREVYLGIPTHDPSKHWEASNIPHVYQAAPKDTFKTEKVAEAIVKYPATTEHPAQTEMVTMDKNVGIMRVEATTGKVSPAEKSGMLERIDHMIVTTKKARSKANQAEVSSISIGEMLFEYIHNGTEDCDEPEEA